MRRRQRRAGTYLLRAGERTLVFQSETGAPFARFRAMTLKGEPCGRIDYETGDLASPSTHTEVLAAENVIETGPILKISIVPEHDTAITFVPKVDRKGSALYLVLGFVFICVATFWTAWDFFGG